MKKMVLSFAMAGVLGLQSILGTAQESARIDFSEAHNTVQSMLAAGSSGRAVVDATMASGMSLSEATVFAMVSGGESHRVNIAEAGISAAGNTAQALTVADAVLATAGETGPVADAVREVLQRDTALMERPSVYEDDYTPTGAGVSPST